MGRIYAVVLGSLAFSTVVFRSLILGGSPEEALRFAILSSFAFAGFGWIVATIADHTLVTAVRTKFAQAMRDRERTASANPAT